MADLGDLQNEVIRQEIEEYIEREDERQAIINLYANTSPLMHDMAANIILGHHLRVDELTKQALEDGIGALEVMDDGLIAGMAIVGIKFRENFIFVPEVLACARAMKAGMQHIEPILSASGIKPIGRVIMGTVKGDLHDIGKNLCIMMLRGAGFEVFDLGVDTSPDEFIDAVENNSANNLRSSTTEAASMWIGTSCTASRTRMISCSTNHLSAGSAPNRSTRNRLSHFRWSTCWSAAKKPNERIESPAAYSSKSGTMPAGKTM